jgi:hypothetical protein
MDISALASTLASYLSPYLPSLFTLGEQETEEVGKELGADARELVEALWRKLHPKLEARPAAKEAIQAAAHVPGDLETHAVLQHHLQQLLAAEPHLASDLEHLLVKAQAPGNPLPGSAPGSDEGEERTSTTPGSRSDPPQVGT